MPRTARTASGSDIYHITQRGAGRQLLFEDDEDRLFLWERWRKKCDSGAISVLAWCFMDNHIHFLIRCAFPDLSSSLRSINTSYAQFYNGRHGHIGSVFQGRFASSPVEDDAYLLTAVRYIHLNPKDLIGPAPEDYKWSSYRQYLTGEEGICDTKLVLDAIGGRNALARFHDVGADELAFCEEPPRRPAMSDTEASVIAKREYGRRFADEIVNMSKQSRDFALRRLYSMGISIRQMERITGIGRGIIQKAVSERRKI